MKKMWHHKKVPFFLRLHPFHRLGWATTLTVDVGQFFFIILFGCIFCCQTTLLLCHSCYFIIYSSALLFCRSALFSMVVHELQNLGVMYKLVVVSNFLLDCVSMCNNYHKIKKQINMIETQRWVGGWRIFSSYRFVMRMDEYKGECSFKILN